MLIRTLNFTQNDLCATSDKNTNFNISNNLLRKGTERSNEVNDITVDESNGSLNEVNAINPNIAIVENVAEMESVDVMAGADAANSGEPLIEVIDEGQVVLSSGGTESFEDSSSSSSLTPIFSDTPPDFANAMDESDSPPNDTSSPPSLPPPSGQVGSRYEGRSLCAKAKVLRGTASVRQSPLRQPLSGKHVLPQVVASKPKGSGLRRSASLAELYL